MNRRKSQRRKGHDAGPEGGAGKGLPARPRPATSPPSPRTGLAEGGQGAPAAHPEPTGKRDQNRRERTQALLDAGLALFLDHGVEGVGVEAIAHAAGLAKGSFYNYFEDQPALVDALLAPAREGVRAAFASCREALQAASDPSMAPLAYLALAQSLGEVVKHHARVCRLYLQEARGPAVGARAPLVALAAEIAAAALDLSREAQRLGLLKPVDPRVSSLAVIGATERLLHAHLEGELEKDGQAVAADLVSMILQGILAS